MCNPPLHGSTSSELSLLLQAFQFFRFGIALAGITSGYAVYVPTVCSHLPSLTTTGMFCVLRSYSLVASTIVRDWMAFFRTAGASHILPVICLQWFPGSGAIRWIKKILEGTFTYSSLGVLLLLSTTAPPHKSIIDT